MHFSMYDFQDAFEVFELDKHNPDETLHREVVLVQCKRRRRCALQDDHELNDVLDPQVGDRDGSRVMKMKFRVYKTGPFGPLHSSKNTYQKPENEDGDDRKEAERMFSAYCWQFGIPFLPSEGGGKNDKFQMNNWNTKQNAGLVESKITKFSSTTGNKKEKKNSSGNADKKAEEGPQRKSIFIDLNSARDMFGGGGGGGKNPRDDTTTTDTDMTVPPTSETETSSEPTDTSKKFKGRLSRDERLAMIKRKGSGISSIGESTWKGNIKFRQHKSDKGKGHSDHETTDSSDQAKGLDKDWNVQENTAPTLERVKEQRSLTNVRSLESQSVTDVKKNRRQPVLKKKRVTLAEPDSSTESDESAVEKPPILPHMPQTDHSQKGTSKGQSVKRRSIPKRRRLSKHAHQQLLEHRGSIISTAKPREREKPFAMVSGKQFGLDENPQSLLISSVNEVQPLNERDGEWLDWSSSEDDKLDEEAEEREKQRDPKTLACPIDPDLKAFLDETRILDQVTLYLGLDPFERVTRSNKCVQVKWNRKSWHFICFCLHAVVFFIITLSSITALVEINTYKEPFTKTQEIVLLDNAQHLAECIFFVIIALFLTIWSQFVIFQLGPHAADFRTRFHLSVCLIQYNLGGIREMVMKHAIFVIASSVVFVIATFGGRANMPFVRESCGFIGWTVIHPLSHNPRESVYYPLVEIFGCFVFLYCYICLNIVLSGFAVYGKALESMARKFNLRLVYSLGKVFRKDEKDGRVSYARKIIPFKKLFAEHRAITSLFQYFGHVNAVSFYAFFLSMGLEITLIMNLLFAVFREKQPVPVKTYLEGLGGVRVPVPVRFEERRKELWVKSIVMFSITLVAFFTFGKIMHNAGDALHNVIDYTRRHGLILCRSAKERRFILSMITSFAPRAPYWIGYKGFQFNRSYMLAFLGFVTATSMVFASYDPTRTQLQTYQQCDVEGICNLIKVPRAKLDYLYAGVELPAPTHPPILFPNPGKVSSTVMPPYMGKLLPGNVFIKTLCTSAGANPFASLGKACHATWDLHTLPTVIFTPFLFKIMKTYEGHTSKLHRYYFRVVNRYAALHYSSPECEQLSTNGTVPEIIPPALSACVSEKFSCHHFPYTSALPEHSLLDVVDCFENPVDKDDMDDCRNLNIATPSQNGERINAKLSIQHTLNLPGVSTKSILCCYKYGGYSTEQAKVCNMPDARTLNTVCQLGNNRSRMTESVIDLHDNILRRLEYEEKKGSIDRYLLKNEELLKKCLCRFDGSSPNPQEHESCVVRFLPPCLSANVSNGEVYYALQCKTSDYFSVYIPKLLKVDSDVSVAVSVTHERYKGYCRESVFNDKFVHDDNIHHQDPYGEPGSMLTMADCTGKNLTHTASYGDDCRNWLTPTPDETGQMRSPTLLLKEFGYNHGSRTVVEGGVTKIRLCCLEYSGRVFRNNLNQLRFCNAPSLAAMNDKPWCQDSIKQGYSAVPPFTDSASHRRLDELLKITSGYYFKLTAGGNLLQNKTLHDIWVRCLCAKFIPGLTRAQYDRAVQKCAETTVSPCQLYETNLHDQIPFTNCDHKWGSKLPGKILTPAVFTKQHHAWIEEYRFTRTSPPNFGPCLLDFHWEEKYPVNGTTPVYDCYLKHIPPQSLDDCENLPTPFVDTDSALKIFQPEIRLRPAFLMKNLDNSFASSRRIYCCYHYPPHITQFQSCSLPDTESIQNRCNKPISPVRTKHELELRKKILANDPATGVYFIGNRVQISDPIKWDQPEEIKWKQCICKNIAKSDCEKMYLPPCIVLKTPLEASLSDFYTRCPAKWIAGGPTHLSVSFMMIYDSSSKSFQKVNRYQNSPCPGLTSLDLVTYPEARPPGILTDCYGQDISNSETITDECGNPKLHSADRNNLMNRVPAEIQLIPLNKLKEFYGDPRFFCCFKYGIAEPSEVDVCNMPNANSLRRRCSDGSRSGSVAAAVTKLQQIRASASSKDPLELSLTDSLRVQWTSCICKAQLQDCP